MLTWFLVPVLLQLPGASGMETPGILATLAQIESVRPAGPAQIALLNRALDIDLTSARRSGRLTSGQRDAFSRASFYLSGIGSALDQSMTAPMAQAWRRVGEGMELGSMPWDRSGALAGYRNSFLWLEQLPGQNAGDPSVRGDLYFVAGRVRALGGTIPVWASVPLGEAQPRRQRGIPEEYLQSADQTEVTVPIEIPREGLSQRERSVAASLEQKFNGATVSVMAARGAVDSLRQRLVADRLELHPEISRRYEAMLASHSHARTALQERQWSVATQQIEIAAGYARRILSEMGR